MANFDASIGNNDTEIKYADNGTHFVCTWKKIYLQDQQEVGPFTFQAILQNTGEGMIDDCFESFRFFQYRKYLFQLFANSDCENLQC